MYKNKKIRGQVLVEYMLLVAVVVIGMVIAMKFFHGRFIKPVSQGISKKVAKP